MSQVMIKNKSGFTLIELVIVIVLIGILAATALPKFINLTVQARNASNQGVAGGLGAAVAIAHAGWIAAGSSVNTVDLEGTNVSVNGSGWPSNGAAGNLAANDCVQVWNQVLNNPPMALIGESCPPNIPECYLASIEGGICKFTLGSDPLIAITYNASNGAVATTSHTNQPSQ